MLMILPFSTKDQTDGCFGHPEMAHSLREIEELLSLDLSFRAEARRQRQEAIRLRTESLSRSPPETPRPHTPPLDGPGRDPLAQSLRSRLDETMKSLAAAQEAHAQAQNELKDTRRLLKATESALLQAQQNGQTMVQAECCGHEVGNGGLVGNNDSNAIDRDHVEIWMSRRRQQAAMEALLEQTDLADRFGEHEKHCTAASKAHRLDSLHPPNASILANKNVKQALEQQVATHELEKLDR